MIEVANARSLENEYMSSAGGETVGLRSATSKWGEALDGGFQIVPDVLFRHQKALRLNNNDLVVLLHLTMAWWEADRAPFTRPNTIASRMGASERTVQRSLSRIVKQKLLKRIKLATANGEKRQAFDLKPLAQRLAEIASYDFHADRRREARNRAAEVQTQSLAQA